MNRIRRLTFFLFHSTTHHNHYCDNNNVIRHHHHSRVLLPKHRRWWIPSGNTPSVVTTTGYPLKPWLLLASTSVSDHRMNSTTATTSQQLLLSPIPSSSSLIDYLIERTQSRQTTDRTDHPNHHISRDNNNNNNSTTHIVIGNEAGDADSIISTIVYAYILDCCGVIRSWPLLPPPPRHVPIVSISDIDLQTQRPETLFLLKLVGIVPHDHLIYINTCHDYLFRNENNHTEQTIIDVTLVDHNRFNQELFRKYIENHDNCNSSSSNHMTQFNVVNIVDHHIDEGYHMDTCHDSGESTDSGTIRRRNIAFDANSSVASVASTCTLLVEILQQQQQQQYFQSTINGTTCHQFPWLPASVSLLLLGVILLDSINMNVKAGKGTTRDKDAIQYLLQYTDWESKNHPNGTYRLPTDTIQLLFHDRNENRNDVVTGGSTDTPQRQPNTDRLFETLQNAKFALEFWQSLSVRDALRLDYKMFSTKAISSTTATSTVVDCLGISTVLVSYSDFKMKPDFVSNIVRTFINDMRISLLCIMLASTTTTNHNPPSPNESKNNNLNREIVFIGPNATVIDELLDYLLNTDTTLQLVEISSTTTTLNDKPMVDTTPLFIRAFQQNNNAASRKQVAPLLMKYFTTTI